MKGQEVRLMLMEARRLLAQLAAGSVQVVFADPPYGIAYHSNHYQDRNPHAPIARDWDFQIGPFLADAGRALAEGGALYVCTRWDVYPLWAPWVQPPLKLSNLIVWKKDNWSAGDLTGNFGAQYELVMFITKGRHRRRGRRFSNVWDFPRVPHGKLLMPAQKPEGLVRRAIEASSDEGQLVVDPFAGSGTTGAACMASGRECLLGDIDPDMVRMSASRLGLPVPEDLGEPEPAPECPIFHCTPPAPHLWGLHPEDLAYFKTNQ